MKTLNIITSTMALGVMIGVTGTHYQQVEAMTSNGGATFFVAPVVAPAEESPEQTMTLVSQSGPVSVSEQETVKYQKDLDARETALMEILREIRKEQTHIRSQISDTNRDMSELTFRVDSHSTQFRPLRAESISPRAMVVPDDNFDASYGAGGLLPPKQ